MKESLQDACKAGDISLCTKLISSGADVNEKTSVKIFLYARLLSLNYFSESLMGILRCILLL